MIILTYVQDGELKTELIDRHQLCWYLKHTTVYAAREVSWPDADS